ncbi:FAD-binding oxidoreductase [Aquibium sp. ELW1220]|jgi:glycine/D-amino acid oxidase-like deaminating enzyme|uniref:NAD(P)/FAD-dependent oxidoreductase n=1 Tax=Aquibium sp. ELW1220 TaxID=2976766 RepID=UPI0025B1DFD8|nr:FAD-binding oxidoreductase [Aquibium sp. ELW1220]MDN2582674.1 FAD-binding oxidoreductase [Aquibium sp. ELW1220]
MNIQTASPHQFHVVPVETEVVIIGGGIVGVCTALQLAQRGIPTVLCEKGTIGEEQSSRNWGWVRKMGRDIREMPLMIQAMKLWDDIPNVIGADPGFRRRGITYFCDQEKDMAKYEPWMKAMEPFGLDTHFVGRERANQLATGNTRNFAGGLHTPSDGYAEPHLASRLIADGARRLGATIVEGCAVRGFETAGGRVSEVVTEKGRIRCNTVILAGGIWSSLFARNQNVKVPQLKMLSQVMRTRPVAGGPEGCGSGNGFGFRKRNDGGYNVGMRSAHPVDIVPDSFRYLKDYIPAMKNEWRAMKFRIGRRTWQETMMLGGWKLDQRTPFETYRIMRPEPGHSILDQATINVKKLFPQFQDMVVNERMSAWIDVTPDAIPTISPVEAVPGFFVSTGYSGHGFGIAPAAGQLMAELVTGETPHVDAKPFRHSRFIDGSEIVHWPIGF